ncbi:MAG: hypothetical protein INQ03_15060 [Candidatus Heimdallarchaeota archaeon]|nr:hypothetical protein [Candidatus Heimdallarchaeota archaeon]
MKWIIKFSNIHPELVDLEIKYLLPKATIDKQDFTIFVVTASTEDINKFINFSSLAREILWFGTFIPHDDLLIDLSHSQLEPIFPHPDCELSSNDTVAIRYYQVGQRNKDITSPEMERNIASKLYKLYPFKVDLKNASREYHAFSTEHAVFMGWVYHQFKFDDVHARAPMKSPFFSGGALKPHLARVMVNLLQPLPPYILDPFSGHGGILREIAHMGSTAIGLEIRNKISRECKKNNQYHKLTDLVFNIVGDAIYPPFRRGAISHAICDPPYGLQTTLIGRDREQLLSKWLEIQHEKMTLVFSSPSEMLNKLPENWKVIDDVDDYVHKSLTRRIRKVMKN